MLNIYTTKDDISIIAKLKAMAKDKGWSLSQLIMVILRREAK